MANRTILYYSKYFFLNLTTLPLAPLERGIMKKERIEL